MGTKINQSVYGTVPTTQYSNAVCPKTILNLYNDGNFDPSGNCENGFEKSISPWGIGGGMCGDWFTINAQRSANGRYARLRMDTMESFNKPISFWNASLDISPYDSKKTTRNRIAGNCFKATNQNIESNGATELGLTLIGINRVNSPYGKLEYNNSCAYPFYINITKNDADPDDPLGAVRTYTIDDLDELVSDDESWFKDSFEMTAFTWGFAMYNASSGSPTQFSGVNIAPVTTKAFKAGEMYKALALEDNNNPDTFYDDIIVSAPNVCGAYSDLGSRLNFPRTCDVYNDDIKLISNKFTNTTHANYCSNGAGKLYGVGNGNKHVFDDISYHYEIRFFVKLNGFFTEVNEGELILSSQQLYILPYFKIDETSYSSKWDSIKAIIRHELAFIGFPFTMSNSQRGFIGDNNVSVPVFDSHMITTGRYITGSAASQLPNAQWGDIFSDTMPEYDPDYNPPKPTPSTDDFGDLYNFGSWNKFPSCLTAYAMSLEKFQSVLQSINSMYQTDTDGVKQWELDFKGSNPSDYIVGAYVSVCNFGLTDTAYPITIGPVNLADKVPSMTAFKIAFGKSGYFDCGSVDIEPFYNDFRDYAPYTQLELYLPLCGNVDLDPAYFMGHSVSITYYYDYNTMSCSACIYRDGITLYKVVNGSIGAEIPLTSMRMGDYQNAIHTLEQAQKQNEIRMASAMVSMGISAVGLLAAPATGGTSLGLTALGLSGVKSGIETVNAIEDINYTIEHKQPVPTQTGASESQNAFCVGSMYPYLFIKRAKMLEDFNAEIYGHTVGYACNVNAHIGDMSGYTVATNIDTSGINATVEEINAIKQAFSKGVYI